MIKGPLGGSLSVLSQDDVESIHEASLQLLEDHGLYCESEIILDIFLRAGAIIDKDRETIKLPPDMVEAALQSSPNSFVLHGREEQYDLLIEPGRIYYGFGGTSEPFIFDYRLNGPRLPTKEDMIACTRAAHALPNINFVMALCSAGDVPKHLIYLHEYDALFRNTVKPVIYTSPGQRHTHHFLSMAAAASGGESILRKRPCVVLFTQPVSPMQISRYSEGMLEAAELGIPIMSSPGPMMGATSPATLAGTLAQINAEALIGIVLAQIIKPGTPVIYAPHTGVMDMTTAQCTYGSPEQTLARAAVAQMGLFYNLPTFGLGGGVEAKLPDAEAAAQSMMGMLTNAFSGLTLTQTLGTLASGLYGSMEMAVICDEIAHMIKRILAGIGVNDETLALDVIKEVGHGGSYLAEEHTARTFRSELFFPVLFQRQSIEQWQERGSQSMTQVAHDRVQQILEESGPIELPDGADDELLRRMEEGIADVEQNEGEL